MTKKKVGFAFHVHHLILIEWCTDYQGRVDIIKQLKPAGEQELRLKLFQLIPSGRLPDALFKAKYAEIKAKDAYDKAWDAEIKAGDIYAYAEAENAYIKTGDAYDKARDAYITAGDAYITARNAWAKTRDAYAEAMSTYEASPECLALHAELCPECPWNGTTIFP